MQSHNLIQGTPQWLAYRREHFNASDAPAMMNASPYKTRAALLRELSTGLAPEVTDQQQYLFDRGHKFEGASRGMAETILGQELYPVVGSLERLSSSFDGLNMAETIDWEHKTLNNELRACFTRMLEIPEHRREGEAGRLLPLHHRIQMEQQLHISGAEKCLFTASRWSDDGELLEASHCWYFPDTKLRAEILAGWEQFERDLASYAPPPPAVAVAEGRAPNVLPALRIEIKGEVTASNLAEFKATALQAIRGVNRHLATDQDFADAEAAVKWCADVESRLDAAKQHALSQTSTIDQLFRTIDEIAAEARRVRLEVDKLVKGRKETIREEIVREANAALMKHASELSLEIAPIALNISGIGDFAGAIKGKRTVQTLREACDAELAKARIAVDNRARGIRTNLSVLRELAAGREVLFPDLGTLVYKQPDDFAAAVRQRIADADRAQERLQAEAKAREDAARVRAEAERVARIKDYLEAIREGGTDATNICRESAHVQREIEHQIRHKTPTPERFQEFYDEAVALFDATMKVMVGAKERYAAAEAQRDAELRTRAAATPAPAGVIDRGESPVGKALMPAAAAPAANEPATLKLGTVCERLGFTVSAAFVETTLGLPAADRAGAARKYRESDFPRICAALVDHIHRTAARDWHAAA